MSNETTRCMLCGGRHEDPAQCPEAPGYDRPTYLDAPLCPQCGRLYCYCVGQDVPVVCIDASGLADLDPNTCAVPGK